MDIVFIDETFDINQSPNYHLSVQAGLNGYSFSVFDSVRNKYILLRHYSFTGGVSPYVLEEKIADIQKNDEFLTREYKTVLFSYTSPKYTLIPGPLFNKENLKMFFEFNHVLDELDEIHYNTVKSIDAFNIFIVPEVFSNNVRRAFSNVKFYHQVTPLIENGLPVHGRKSSNKIVIANIYDNFADVLVIDGDRLLLCNTFRWLNEEDLVYFIMYVYDQMKLKGTEVPLVLSGSIRKNSLACVQLRAYVKNLLFERRNERFIYSYTFNDVDPHWFSNFLNLRLCV